jgi:hypothetical protein
MVTAKTGVSLVDTSPKGAGDGPQSFTRPHGFVRRTTGWALACSLATGLVLAACANSDTNQVTQPVVLGMTSTITPVYQDQELTLYEAQVPVPLPVRAPTPQDKAGLGKATAPYSHAPFLLASDERLEIHFTLTNLDDQRHAVDILLDPWNEFVRWSPGVTIVSDEETLPNESGITRSVVLDGKTRVEGTFTQDDTTQMAIGLATCMEIQQQMPPPAAGMQPTTGYGPATLMNHVFDPQNRLNQQDPLTGKYVPPVIAGLTGFDLGIRAQEAMNVAIEITIDLTDLNGNRIIPQGQQETAIGLPPAVLKPAGAM